MFFGAAFDHTGDMMFTFAQGWTLDILSGRLRHADSGSEWEGQPEDDELKEGDVVVRPTLAPTQSRGSRRCVWRRACCSTSTLQP